MFGGQRFILPFDDGRPELDDYNWFVQPPRSHHQLPDDQRLVERRRAGHHLIQKSGFHAPCSRDELQLCVTLESPDEAKRLKSQIESLNSGMHGMQSLLLDQFIEKDYGDDLLLLTATEQPGGRLVGLVFWRYLRSVDDDFWNHVLVDWGEASCQEGPPTASEAAGTALQASAGYKADLQPPGRRPAPDAWALIELLCTDEAYRGHGVGKLLLVAALAYSAVKDGKVAAVLTLGHGDDNKAAADLYRKLGFQQMPKELFREPDPDAPMERHVDPRHVLVLWNIERGLGSLKLQDVCKDGTRVPQLEGSIEADDGEERLDPAACAEVVDRLTG